jgi:hypothetical protein
MVIANIGTISLALPAHPVASDFLAAPNMSSVAGISTAATQVRLLSLSNTFSRLIGGPVADFISPVASYLPSGILALPRQHKVSRIAFLWASCILMMLAFLWMVIGVRTQEGVWAFRFGPNQPQKCVFDNILLLSSIGIGIAYGSVFTVL